MEGREAERADKILKTHSPAELADQGVAGRAAENGIVGYDGNGNLGPARENLPVVRVPKVPLRYPFNWKEGQWSECGVTSSETR